MQTQMVAIATFILQLIQPRFISMHDVVVIIAGSALALHCCKTHANINRKMGNSTPL